MTSESPPARLLDDAALEASAVVANCDMNRERQLSGVNSYARELGFSPLDWLTARLDATAGTGQATVGWLDLCCGTGRALIQAAATLRQGMHGDQVALVGLDLAGIRLPDGRPAGRQLARRLRAAGFSYDARRHRVSCSGRKEVRLPYEYLGADDRAGPHYTGQPAVHSYYAELS